MQRYLIIVMFVMLAGLQYRLWVGEGSFADVSRLEREITDQKAVNAALQERNQALAAKVQDYKTGMDGVEERARYELGMVKDNETFYLVVSP